MYRSDASNDDLYVELWLNKYQTDGQLLFKPKESNAYEFYRYKPVSVKILIMGTLIPPV